MRGPHPAPVLCGQAAAGTWLCAVLALGAVSFSGCERCRSNEVEEDGACLLACNSTRDCAGSDVCTDGVCRPGGAGGGDAGTPAMSGAVSGATSGALSVGGTSSASVTSTGAPSSGTTPSTGSGGSSQGAASSQRGVSTASGSGSTAGSVASAGTSMATSAGSAANTSGAGSGGASVGASTSAGSGTASSTVAGSSSKMEPGGFGPPVALNTVLSGTTDLAASTASAQASPLEFLALDGERAFFLFGVATVDNAPECALITGELVPSITGRAQLNFTRSRGAGCGLARVTWQVAVFTSGVRVQRGTAPMGSTMQPVVLPRAVDPARSFVVAHLRTGGSSTGPNDVLDAQLNATSILFRLGANAVSGQVSWQVVELAEGSVLHLPFTIPVDTTSTSLGQLPQGAMVLLGYSNALGEVDTDDATLGITRAQDGTTQVRRVGVGGTCSGTAQVVQWPAGVVSAEVTAFLAGNQPVVLDPGLVASPSRTLAHVPGWHHAACMGNSGGGNIDSSKVFMTRALSTQASGLRVTVQRLNADNGCAAHVQLFVFP